MTFSDFRCPRPSIGAHSLILFRLFCEVRKVITFEAFWAGAGGRGRGLPEPSDSEILTKDPARPAPPEGGAANIYEGLRPLPPAPKDLKVEDPMIGRFEDPMDG